MALYELTMQGTLGGKPTLNRWNYEFTGTPVSASGSELLIRAFDGYVEGTGYDAGALQALILVMLSSQYTLTGLQAYNLYDDTDFYTTGTVGTLVGGQSGEMLPRFNCFGFRSTRSTRAIRRATKRFRGVAEADAASGVLAGGGVTRAEAVRAKMSLNLEVTEEEVEHSFECVVLGRESYIVPESGNTAYRYYSTLSEQLDHIMRSINWETYNSVRHQTSGGY